MPLPERLRQARERLDLKLEEVSRKAGVGVSSISEFETGRREPGISQLYKLAKAYEMPITFFFDDKPIQSEHILWRGKPRKPFCDRIESRFINLCRQYRNLEKWTNNQTSDLFKLLLIPAYPRNYDEVESIARRTHREMELGGRPATSLLTALTETYGIKVFHLSLISEASSACTYTTDMGPAIMLNKKNKRWRRNFDLAHELFHLITSFSSGRPKVTKSGICEEDEKYADKFASVLLLPEESLKDAIGPVISPKGTIGQDDLDSIARQFDVSIEALCWRICWVYRIPSPIIKKYVTEAVSHQCPRENEEPKEYPSRYCALTIRALRLGEISAAKAAEYLGVNVGDIMEYLGPKTDEPTQIPVTTS